MAKASARKPAGNKRVDWKPPVLFAALAFSTALAGDALDLVRTVSALVVDPPLPKVTEEYLMIEIAEGNLDFTLGQLTTQIAGLRILRPAWLDEIDRMTDEMRQHFCQVNEFNMESAFAGRAAEREAEIARCLAEAVPTVLVGGYALRSASPEAVEGLAVELAVLTGIDGPTDAYDGFLSGRLSAGQACFVRMIDGIEDLCVATWSETEVVTDIPALGPGEQVLIPIFLSVGFLWERDGSMAGDGFAPSPFRFPARVMLGDRVLIGSPRPMLETPNLRAGFYVGRG
jgi:hypothetical protein